MVCACDGMQEKNIKRSRLRGALLRTQQVHSTVQRDSCISVTSTSSYHFAYHLHIICIFFLSMILWGRENGYPFFTDEDSKV